MAEGKDATQQMGEFLEEIDIETRMRAELLDPTSGPFFTEQEEARIEEIMRQALNEDPGSSCPGTPSPSEAPDSRNVTGHNNGRVTDDAW